MPIDDADVKFVEDEDEDSSSSEETSSEGQDEGVEVVPKEHYENLKKALQETRGKSKAEVESLRRRVEAYEKTLAELQSSVTKDELEDIFEGMDDGDVVTVAGVKKVIEEQVKKLNENEARTQQVLASVTVSLAEAIFKQTHPDFDEVTSSYQDLLKDRKFMESLLEGGITKAPQKFYEYCKKQLESEGDGTNEGKPDATTGSIKKPATMTQKSKAGSAKIDPTKLTIEDKRKMKLTKEQLDKAWMDLVK